MLEVSDTYKRLALQDARQIDVKINIGGTYYYSENIASLNIYRTTGDGGLVVGNAFSDYCRITLSTTNRIKSGVRVIPYVQFKGDEDSEWLQLGDFSVTDTKPGIGTLEIEAHDKMYTLDKRCTYLGSASGNVSPLSFPATMQQMLKYICDIKGLECDFKCEDFTVSSRPMANPDGEGDDKYYTHRQLLAFIAGAHGANACIDSNGKLVFRRPEKGSEEYIDVKDCVDPAVDSEEPFIVKAIRLQVGKDYLFINDTGELYSDDMDGVLETANPLGSMEIVEYMWKVLGNFEYCSCNLSRRGLGWTETGDLMTIDDIINNKRVTIIAQTIELSFAPDTGFVERIVSEAETSEQSINRAVSSTPGNSSSGTDSAVYFSVGSGNIRIAALAYTIVSVKFSAQATCIPLFSVTIPFVVTRAGTVKFNIVFDGTTINTYSQDCPAGVHFKTITMPLVGTGNGGHTVSVQILSADAAGTVDGANTYATVYGSGLEANAAWDGTIRVTQEIPHFTLRSDNITLQDVSAKLTHRVWEPVRRGFDVAVGKLELTSDSITLETFDEAVDVVTEDIPHIINTEKVKITLDPPQITLGGINDKASIKQEE